MKKILLAFIMAFAVCSAVSAQIEARASRTWEVQKYDIVATLPSSDSDRYLGARASVTLKNVSASAASSLTLRISPSAEVSGVKINGATGDFTKGEEKVGGGTLQRIIIRGLPTSSGGTMTVEIAYKLKVAANSGVNTISPVGSLFLPLSFWYPTPNSWFFTRGADFAPVKIQVEGANGLSVVGSGTESAANVYEQKLNAQPFFVTGAWDPVTAGGVTALVPKGGTPEDQKRAGEIAQFAADARTFMAGVFGSQPETPLRIVGVRRGAGFSSGGTILIDESAFRRPKIDSLTAVSVAEAVAKIWIGGALKVDGDGGGVVREGLSRYLATQFIETKFGREVADIERMRQRTAYAAVARRDSALSAVSPLDDYYFTANTNKGAMIWRLLAQKSGAGAFNEILRAAVKDGATDLAELRALFVSQKELLDYMLDQVTDMDLLVGVPQVSGGETKVALRNTGAVDVSVEVVATTVGGEKLRTSAVVPKQSFGSASFTNAAKIARVEVDGEKLYPQVDYSNDVAPREIDESDLLLFAKKAFDRQDFPVAEKNARTVLSDLPHFDDVRVVLARALLAEGKNAEAEREFKAVLTEKLPTARSIAWSSAGLGDIAARTGQSADALKYYDDAIRSDGGATVVAQQAKQKLGLNVPIDEQLKSFFAQFDKAAISGNKVNVEALIMPGEELRFSGGIGGQAQEWTSRVVRVDRLSANLLLVEVAVNLRLINKEAESGTAVYRMVPSGAGWRILAVESFEVRQQ